METVDYIVCPDDLQSKLEIDRWLEKVSCPDFCPVVHSVEELSTGDDPYANIRDLCDRLVLTWGCPQFRAIRAVPMKIGVIAATPVPYVEKEVFDWGTKVYVVNSRIARSVAEHAIYLALDGLRNGSIDKKGGFKKNQDHLPAYSKTVGIIGMGEIGKRIFKIIDSFGASILYFDPFISSFEPASKANNLKEVMCEANIVFICCSFTKQTKALINESLLLCLPRDSVVVNVARGSIMPDKEILKTIQSRPDIRFRVDVLENESYENPLFKISSVRITSHLGGPIPYDFPFLISDIFMAMNAYDIQSHSVTTVSSREELERYSEL